MKEPKLFNRNFILLMFINTLLFISFNLINPVLPEYCISKGLTVTLAGFVSGCLLYLQRPARPGYWYLRTLYPASEKQTKQ